MRTLEFRAQGYDGGFGEQIMYEKAAYAAEKACLAKLFDPDGWAKGGCADVINARIKQIDDYLRDHLTPAPVPDIGDLPPAKPKCPCKKKR